MVPGRFFRPFFMVFHGSRSVFNVFFKVPGWVFRVPGGILWLFKVPGWFFKVPGFHGF